MSDRAFLFVFSILVVVASLGAAGWLLASGQAGSVDGLFLLLTCLLIALAFSLYLVFVIRRAMESLAEPPAAKPKAVPATQAKPAPVAQ
ncbi:MAG TPA: hypothetical protein VFA33_26860 [Bryobacteraceae bacterium]|nr:hypothetical protein [Bryobacteraceae bacterium]